MEGCNTAVWKSIIDRYYTEDKLRDILVGHSRQVADMALAIASGQQLDIPRDNIETAAMLHDIGIIATHAPGICCFGTQPYLMHGSIGATMLREAGAPDWACDVAERHTGAGLLRNDIIAAGLPDPGHDLLPRTVLERLICYADKFFSKTHIGAPAKPIERVRASIAKFGAEALARFDALHAEFGGVLNL
ncbi:MAG: HDIG domain-containing protein [Muribaculaceae bacterium]|nr:HDIG domain-containing protein [Muribaculaceae bacterium]